MLTVLSGLAEFERDLIRARTTEGRERAKRFGVKMGWKPKLTQPRNDERSYIVIPDLPGWKFLPAVTHRHSIDLGRTSEG
jgi:hypothetical protein